ncbi:hypothetical protein EHS25_001204 [Saitozyma podzolica]|uniref:Apurinic-apyrimidinic endonuclease 1 n=1 Tax=Saitozyma podzolica TaxID=1890683 RepID=A0A427YHG9_9TREE|nr:hypothetical protein EHS25_001204 [Saitozyma podzolica]
MPPRRSTSSVKRYRESTSPLTSSEDDAAYTPAKVTPKTKGARSIAVKTDAVIVEAAVNVEAAAPPAKKPRASKGKISKEDGENYKRDVGGDEAVDEKSKKKTPKAKMWPPPDLDPANHPARSGFPIFALSPTTVSNGSLNPSVPSRPMLLGAHVSMGGGPATALLRASKAGANGLALFVKNQRSWKSNPYEDEAIQRFRDLMRPRDEGGMGYPPESILVHGSYLINLGNPDTAKWNMSYECFRDDLRRCHQLGIKLYNWHPGSTVGACSKEESLALVAKAINKAHAEVPEVVCVVENMANANSNILGTTFSDLATIIRLVEDKSRIRVCLDTCHTFAAGYDIRTNDTYAVTMRKFGEEVGFEYLGGMHLNDSKAGLGACKDLHENIGLGDIGLTAFRCIMRDPRMSHIPLILETPAADKPLEVGELAVWVKEIKLLYEIQAIPEDEWSAKSVEIEKRWRADRDVMNPPKEPKGKAKNAKKAKKGKKDEDEEGSLWHC